jgi:hypothetical protein
MPLSRPCVSESLAFMCESLVDAVRKCSLSIRGYVARDVHESMQLSACNPCPPRRVDAHSSTCAPHRVIPLLCVFAPTCVVRAASKVFAVGDVVSARRLRKGRDDWCRENLRKGWFTATVQKVNVELEVE